MKNITIENLLEEMKTKALELENAKVKIAISGQSGSGKSSIINSIIGNKVAKVGSVETTIEIESYNHQGLEFFDLPGCGTKSFPVATYINDCKLLTYDAFIIVTSNRFYENDEWLIREMVNAGRDVYVVRTKMDEAVTNEKRDNDLEIEEVYTKVKVNILDSVANIGVKGVYLISTVEGVIEDFEKLLEDIEYNLDGIKKTRFLLDVTPYSVKVLDSKRKAAGKIISYSSGVAAANGLNPIIGLDVSVDIAVLMNLSKQISNIFGISDDEINYATKKYNLDAKFVTLSKQFAGKFIAKEGIMLLLKKFGTSVVAKSFFKFIPFAGQAIAAGIGYKMTYSFGQEMLNEAYNLAENVLEAAKEKNSNHFFENNTIKK